MDASALYEPPFTNLHAGGPDGLFGGYTEPEVRERQLTANYLGNVR